MKKTLDEKDKKEFLMEKKDYNVKFTLLDMGNYVGYKNRNFYECHTPYWETMFIDIDSQDVNKCLKSEFLIDSNGEFLRLIILDNNENKRVINRIEPQFGIKEEDYEFYYGKGIYKDNDMWLKDFYVEKSSNKTYYYEQETDKFVNDNGIEVPKDILTNKNLGSIFINSAKIISEKFNDEKNTPELEDIEFGSL